MTIGRRTLPVDVIIGFLQAAARGIPNQYPRGRDYWFPTFSEPRIGEAMASSRREVTSQFWQSSGVPQPILSDDIRQAYEDILRHKLRVIWHRAIARNHFPQPAAERLRIEMRGFAKSIHVATSSLFGLWGRRTDEALRWLEDNTHNLRLCGVVDCKLPHFIATASRKTYCSKACQNAAEIERSKRRVRANADAKKAAALRGEEVKGSRLTSDGKERIARAAKATAERRRLEKQRNDWN